MKIKLIFGIYLLGILLFAMAANCKSEQINGSVAPPVTAPITPPAITPGIQSAIKILFVGNSLTYSNNMPDIFKNLAAVPGKEVYVDQATPGGVDLRHLISDQLVLNKINSMKWDYVVLQSDDITAFSDMYQIEISTIEKFKRIIYQNNPSTKIIYTMIWGLRDGITLRELNGETVNYSYEVYFNKIYDGTLKIAQMTNLKVAPVGLAWKFVIKDNYENRMQLFSEDKAHPALHGSYIMACVMNDVILQNTNPNIQFYCGIPVQQAKYYQQKALLAIGNQTTGIEK